MVYEKYVAPLVQSACKGWNTTVLAYGATSSGKSYTMQGVPGDEGIIPRALEDVFTYIDNSLKDGSTETIFSAHISFVELYNGKFRQLLEDEDQIASKTFCCSKQENRESSKVEVRETKGGKVYLVGGSSLKRPVINLEEVLQACCNHTFIYTSVLTFRMLFIMLYSYLIIGKDAGVCRKPQKGNTCYRLQCSFKPQSCYTDHIY